MGVVTTIHTLKGNIQDALDYVLDREKSESHLMSCSNSASPFLAGKKWKVLNEIRSKSEMQEDSTVGYHFIQSFDDKNVTPEKCYELARQWIEKCTKGKYDYVISVHKNTDHVHAHIIVNPINNETGKSWHLYYKRDLKKFRTYSDEICKSYGLEINENKKGISNSWYKHHQIKQGDSNDQMIMKSLDYLCDKVKDYEQLKQCLTVLGYKVEDGFNQTNESLYEDYEFTLNKKMIDTNLTDEFSYFVRIPYTQEYIQIPKEKGQWDEKEQTLKCHMNFNEKHIIYDLKGNIVDEERDGVFIAEHLEDKKIKGRKGLQIKTPFMKKPRRCKFLSNEDMPMGSYSLKNIIDRIENNGINSTLSEIENIINTSSIAEEIKKQRNIFFENANIKTKYNQSEFYKMSNYDKFLYIKSNEIQKSLNHMTKSGEEINNISQLPELKKLKKEITKNLAILNKQIYKLEKQYKEMQGQMFEGVLDITDSELEEWIGEKLNPLRQEKFKLKQQSREVKEKIKEAEKNSISIG